ncbi:hypothetical protein [Mycolicibacterium psychrotolerans]|uniref:Uncharacterized protein n=1 Tax=Mycolicibacterium psychrotolerans TaxID=216929 RepID=A0A7I7MBP0_9MYCO|nr:hypothetical protein [Mycolicibacterium psychrotolerans]BBX69585.1 hypothetical protein MPSYJ_30460 [Mycolicibacterium psychrotolerans]
MTVTTADRNGHNGSPYPDKPAWVDIAKAAQVRDEGDQRAADRYRARDLLSASDRAVAAADALADLRKAMADNADVFTSSGVLAHTSRFAEDRSADRYGVLFGVSLHAVLAVPPQVVLPPIIGGEVSLNLLLAVVGSSGGGKGTTDKTAKAAVRMKVGGRRVAPVLPMLPIGTGEGINRTYAHAERDKLGSGQVALRWHTYAALFGCRDIATMDALTARQGSTLLPEMLKGYMGEELGFANADKDRRVILPMHSYRLCLSAGVQPENGAVLLNDQARRDGVPQRFLWTPVRPGVARNRRSADAKTVDPLTVEVPDFGIDPLTFDVGDEDDDEAGIYDPAACPLVPMGVASNIAQQIIDADAAKDLDPFGRSADPLAGHRLLAQLKLAAALAVLHNRTFVGPEDWQRAERLMVVSAAVAQVVDAESGAAAQRDAVLRGQIDGHRLAAADDTRHSAALHSLMNRVTRFLGEQTDWVSRSTVDRSVTSKLRRNLGEALASLLDIGAIERREVERAGQTVPEYRIRAV